jgi:probable F420-dependent oxidoreductase
MLHRAVLTPTEPFDADGLVHFADALVERGYDSFWLPELIGREPIATAGYLLGRTRRLSIATGIANVYARDAIAMAQARESLTELSGGRFMLGLGVSNAQFNSARGHVWQAPLTKMTAYLDAMDAVKSAAPAPKHPAPIYIAAHGPKLQALGAARTDGIITYLMPPEHTRQSRTHIGPTAELNAAAMFLAETDPATARSKARAALKMYIRLDYYHREWRKLGFGDADFADGGSDALIDTLVSWGDAGTLRARFDAFAQAGATRVIVLPLGLHTKAGMNITLLDALAC